MMTNALRMTSTHGTYSGFFWALSLSVFFLAFDCFSVIYAALFELEVELCCVLIFRKETLWPELDRLLGDGNDISTGTTYTAAIPEYRVEFMGPEEAAHLERNSSLANGHAVHDAQHPCQ
jgi:hypothetical protein